jgi:catechol 2,3-dioxygenase-like lactoylglutathione lyase family enzyme
VDVRLITSFAIVSPDSEASRGLYLDALGLPLKQDDDGYLHSEEIDGARHFGVWPLRAAAQACFGTDAWPQDRPMPQASVEFEVESAEALDAAVRELEGQGFELLPGPREQPWGQIIARLQTLEGVIVGISFAPSLHE